MILSEWYILTAAHCIYEEKPYDFIILSGLLKINQKIEVINEPTKLGKAKKFIDDFEIHPNFIHDTWENDLAILTVKDPFDFISELNFPVSMVKNIRQIPKIGDICDIAGWGKIYPRNFYKLFLGFGKERIPPDPRTLQMAEVPIWNLEECQKKRKEIPVGAGLYLGFGNLRDTTLFKVTNNTICAGSKAKSIHNVSTGFEPVTFR